jgi:Flavin-binding monooxygenase-like
MHAVYRSTGLPRAHPCPHTTTTTTSNLCTPPLPPLSQCTLCHYHRCHSVHSPETNTTTRLPPLPQVLSYLELYAERHELLPHVRWGTQVVCAQPLLLPGDEASPQCCGGPDSPGPRWRLRTQRRVAAAVHDAGADSAPNDAGAGSAPNDAGAGSAPNDAGAGSAPNDAGAGSAPNDAGAGSAPNGAGAEQPVMEEEFDALIVCNGHYFEPNLPDVPGAALWPGQQLHSHNYRTPDAFAGKSVVIVGASNSGAAAAEAAGGVGSGEWIIHTQQQLPQVAVLPPPTEHCEHCSVVQ